MAAPHRIAAFAAQSVDNAQRRFASAMSPRRYVAQLLLSAVLVGGLTGRAEAQEYCVTCSEPTAIYRCVIDGARPGGGQSLQMLCVTSMAREGQHATCSVKRGTVFECDGPVKRVPWAGAELPVETPASASTTARPQSDPNEPPRTLVDMAKRANEQSAEQAKKANDNVKDSM